MFNLNLYCVRSGNYHLKLLGEEDIPQGYIEVEYLEAEFLAVVTHRRNNKKVKLWFSLHHLTTENFPIPSFSKNMLGPDGFAILRSEELGDIESAEFKLYRRKGLGARRKRELLTV